MQEKTNKRNHYKTTGLLQLLKIAMLCLLLTAPGASASQKHNAKAIGVTIVDGTTMTTKIDKVVGKNVKYNDSEIVGENDNNNDSTVRYQVVVEEEKDKVPTSIITKKTPFQMKKQNYQSKENFLTNCCVMSSFGVISGLDAIACSVPGKFLNLVPLECIIIWSSGLPQEPLQIAMSSVAVFVYGFYYMFYGHFKVHYDDIQNRDLGAYNNIAFFCTLTWIALYFSRLVCVVLGKYLASTVVYASVPMIATSTVAVMIVYAILHDCVFPMIFPEKKAQSEDADKDKV